ncbi:MAG: gliding motility lipoprotein GldB [Flavobacteriaceae bacterium]|nr:gliding motility lipoprotein GldB [Flavobacteriaceae bacterium]
MRYFILLLFFVGFLSCSKSDNKKVDISEIEVKTDIQRFEQKFYANTPEKLSGLKAEFPYLFPSGNPDSVWVNKMQNKDEQELFAVSQKIYNDFTNETKQLENLFKHIKYYYSNFNEPKVITVLSNVDYNNNVVLADSLLFISLDIFLGKDSEIYQEFPNYVKQNYTKEHLIVAVAEKFAVTKISPSESKSYISRMIQEGKKLALTQAFLPDVSKAEIIGYTEEQYVWAEKSEVEIWKYFIQNLMLYSTDSELSARFIDEAPFSKFFLEVDKDSPGKIGVWFGWQIVEAYLKNNDVTIQQLMLKDNEEIFKRSKYKPKKS